MVDILEQHVGMDSAVIAIKELGVQVLVVVVGVHDHEDRRLSTARCAIHPHMRVAVGLEKVTVLMDDALELFPVGKVVARKLLEGFVIFTTFQHVFHLDDDIIQLALLLQITALRHLIRYVHLVEGESTMLEQHERIRVELALGLLVMLHPARVRESPVPRDQVITEILFDLEILQDRTLRHPIDEHEGDVHVADKVIRLVRFGADLDPRDQNVTVLASLRFGLDVGDEEVDVRVHRDIETGIPFPIDRMEGNVGLDHLDWLK